MEDLDVARFVLRTVSNADGGCVPCIQSCVDVALSEQWNLPWEEAVALIDNPVVRQCLNDAVASSRIWLKDGNEPRNDEDLPEIVVSL